MDDSAYQLRLNTQTERGRLAAIPGAAPSRPIVLLLGMHRGGTSLCSHILSMLGVDLTDQIAGPGHASLASDNPRGHWERWEIVTFHDRILAHFNRDYFGLFHDFQMPVAWWADPRVVEIRHEIVAFLEKKMGAALFGFKDPRTVRLMPMWHQIASELRLAPKIVLCLRNPAQVARSLEARDGLDPGIGEYRWLVHMIDFFRYVGTHEYCVVEYETWFDEPRANIEKLKTFLDLEWQQSESDLDMVLSDIVDPALRHDDESQRRDARQPFVRSLYKLATRAGHDPEARAQIDHIVSQFVGFAQLNKPFLRSFESVAAKFRGAETEAESLRAASGEREAALGAATERAGAAESRLADVLAGLEAQRTHLAETEREREAALGAATDRAGAAESRLMEALAGLEAQRASLAEIEREHQAAFGAAAERAGAAESRLAEALAETERERDDRAAALARAADAFAEIEGWRAHVAEIVREHDHRAIALARAEEATESLRSASGAREAAATERADAAESRLVTALAEREALSIAVTDARRVGRAAIAALATEYPVPPMAAGHPGWWQAVMRVFGFSSGL